MADNIQFTNNASALLSASINSVDTAISLEAGAGDEFPTLTGSQYFMAALQDPDGDLEIVKVTARTGDNLTVVRGQEGTVADDWTVGVTRLELRLTKGTMEEMLQKNGGTMAGTLDMNGEQITDAVLDGSGTIIQGGQIVGVPIRGALDDSSNEIAVPDDGSRATAGASPILTQADLASNGGLNFLPVGSIIMWFGTLGSLPAGWQLCNGTNGSPDMRDRFPVGAGASYALGAGGGAATASGSTSAAGAHDHGGATGETSLSEDQIPAHNHRLLASTGGGIGASGTITDGHGLLADYTGGHGANGYIDASASHPSTPWVEEAGGGGGGGHDHSISAVADHTHTLSSISILPPYRAVYFIMRVS